MPPGVYVRTQEIKARQSIANQLAWADDNIRLKYLEAFAYRPTNTKAVCAMHKALELCRKDDKWKQKWIDASRHKRNHYNIKDIVAYKKVHKANGTKNTFPEEHRRHLSESGRGRVITETQKIKASNTMKQKWADPNYARYVATRQNKTPNKAELKLLSILNIIAPNEWKYVGDGKVWIEGRNPDFININCKKIVIELFSHYWHIERARTNDDVSDRINHYKKYGYECIVIWAKQLSIEEVLKCLH